MSHGVAPSPTLARPSARIQSWRRTGASGDGEVLLGQDGPHPGSVAAGLEPGRSGRADGAFGRAVAEASVRTAETNTIAQGSEGLRYFFMDRTLGVARRGDVSVLDFRNSHMPGGRRV